MRIQTLRSKTKPLALMVGAVLMLAWGTTGAGWASNTTTTTLVVKSAGNAVTTVTAGSVVTLTASVTLAGNPVTTGQVAFCNAAATYCTDIHRLGVSQLTLTGSASISFIPGIGSYSYKAVFIPSGSHQGSTSSSSALSVTGAAGYPTTTSFTSVDSLGNYFFTATVVGEGGQQAAPTGTVSFLDTSNSNAVVASAPLGASTPGVAFSAGTTTPVGAYPYGVVTADFNGDGIPDFATANYYGNSATIELGNGDGTFTKVNTSPATGSAPIGIVAADLNGDGKVDLAVTNDGDNSVTILLGNGNGTFTAAASPSTGSGPTGIVAGDFNEDGNQDLAVANQQGSTLTILLGNGNGTFIAAAPVSSGQYPAGLAVADFNNDGHLDLVATNNGTNVVQILIGAGDGTFTAGATPESPGSSTSVAVGDFNGDGNVDMAVIDSLGIAFYVGDGTGNFTLSTTPVYIGLNSSQVVVADFNQDGIDDVAVSNDTGPGSVSIFLGKGDGTFNATSATADNYFTALAVADFNGDGAPDMVATDYSNNVAAVILTQVTETATATAASVTPTGLGIHNIEASYPGSGTTGPSVSGTVAVTGVPSSTTTLVVSVGGKQVTSVAPGSVVTLTATLGGLGLQPAVRSRVARDGVHPHQLASPEVGQVNFCDAAASDCVGIHLLGTAQVTAAGTASMSYVPGIGSHSYKAVFLVDYYGSGSESSVQPLTVTGGYPTTATMQASGTPGNYTLVATVIGESNIAVPVGGTVSFLDASNSNGLLGTATLTGAQSAVTFAPGRTQATGEYPEGMVMADFNGDGYADAVVTNYEDSTVTVLLGKGDGTFTAAPVIYPGGAPFGLTAGDWNDDGLPDLAITLSGDTLAIFLSNGDGTFTAAANPTTGSAPYEIATADFNGDGKADLAVTNYDDFTVSILLGNGDGTFTAASTAPDTGSYPFGIAVADFNGDNRPDIAVTNLSDSTVTILLGNGDGTFVSSTAAVGTYPYLLASGDFNGDGKPDLAVSNYSDNDVSILLGKGDGTFAAATTAATGNSPFALAVADLNRDGKTDLLVASYADSALTLLLGNGDGTFTPSGTAPTGSLPYAMAVADLNGDGVPDVMTPNYGDDTMTVLLTQFLEGAQATLTHVAPLGTGTHNVLASYPVTSPYAASQSATTALAAGIGSSGLTLAAKPTTSDFGDPVVLTATLSPYAPEGVSTDGETVTFKSGSTSLGTSKLASGVAMLTLSTLPIGTSNITAVYAGDASLGASTSKAVAFTVANNALTFSLTGGTAATSIAANGTATYAFMVTPGSSSTFGANVTFAVTGGPSGATTTFNPTSIAAGSGAATVTLTVAMPPTSSIRHGITVATARRLSPIVLAMLLLPFAGRMRRSGKRMGSLLWLVLLVVLSGVGLITGLTGCGGSSTPAATTPTPAAQNYTMTVTATSGSTAKTTSLTLTVN